ncbi:Hypothetical protein D9617_9g024530 [Elsinoe fawcettii]|nr:Hypothetical protein D9617_9g024530 [Elsinoe fawcettii]
MPYSLPVFLSLFAASTALPNGYDEHHNKLRWGSCDDIISLIQPPNGTSLAGLECATLDVPLDYTDPHSPPLTLDVIRSKAASGKSMGNILTNPGGPGGSGVENVVLLGSFYQGVLNGTFDIIGWDTRGTGRTIPFNCNQTDPLEFVPTARDNLTATLLDDGFTKAEAYASSCATAQNITGSYVSTTFTARDMLQVGLALGDWKVNYFGISYGTYLGQTFASLFPENVGSFVLDSVVDGDDNVLGPRYTWLSTTDGVWSAFFSECLAFPSCPLLTLLSLPNSTIPIPPYDASSTASIATALRQFVEANILATLDPSLGPAGPLAFRALKINIFGQLYSPSTWPALADAITGTINGSNTTAFATPTPSGSKWNPAEPDALLGISCLDTPWRVTSAEDLIGVAQRQDGVSFFADAIYDYLTWRCAAWDLQPPERFEGPFGGKTATRVLFVNNRLDPITPITSAVRAQTLFEGSALLVGEGFGHSVLSDPSQCTYAALREYFVNGVLPAEGATCEPDARPFAPDAAAGTASGATKIVPRSVEGKGREQWLRRLPILHMPI